MVAISKQQSDVGEQYARLLAAVQRYDSAAVGAELEANRLAIESGFLADGDLFERAEANIFFRQSLWLQRALILDIATNDSSGTLGRHAREFAASRYLHYRLMRSEFRRRDRGTHYGIVMGEFALSAASAIVCCPRDQTTWMAREYLRHIDEGYQRPYTLDGDFLGFVEWLCRRYLSESEVAPTYSTGGVYGPLVQAAPRGAGRMVEVADLRLAVSYKRIVLNKSGLPQFYATEFAAVCPFDLLAALTFTPNGDDALPTHPLLFPFANVQFAPSGVDPFIARCEAKVLAVDAASGFSTRE